MLKRPPSDRNRTEPFQGTLDLLIRDARAGGWFDRLIQDVRFACRLLRRNHGFALTAVLTITLGIGANTTVFTIVDQVLFRPPPYLAGDRLVQVAGLNRLVSRPRDSRHDSRAGHPGWRRCSSVKYAEYSRLSRLAIRAPRSGT